MYAQQGEEVPALGAGGGAGQRRFEGGEVGEGAVDEGEGPPAGAPQAA